MNLFLIRRVASCPPLALTVGACEERGGKHDEKNAHHCDSEPHAGDVGDSGGGGGGDGGDMERSMKLLTARAAARALMWTSRARERFASLFGRRAWIRGARRVVEWNGRSRWRLQTLGGERSSRAHVMLKVQTRVRVGN